MGKALATALQVKVHPHKSKVNQGIEACVSVTPVRKGGRAHYRGTVRLKNARFVIHQSGVKRARAEQVRNVHAWCVGEVTADAQPQVKLSPEELAGLAQVTYHFSSGRFITVAAEGEIPTDVTDREFAQAVFVGRDFYVSREALAHG